MILSNIRIMKNKADEHYFNQVGILFCAFTWPQEQYIAPETLIEDMVPVETMPDNPLHIDVSR